MPVRIGMNGWGRIGRYLARIMAEDGTLELGVINARASNEDLAHLFKYDSVHGTFPGEVGTWDEGIVIAGRKIKVTRNAPGEWTWGDEGCDLVVESTGKFTDRESCEKHLACGAKKVVISAPGKKPDVTVVMGVNDDDYDPAAHKIVSNASCTTNCLAPAAKVLHEKFGIKHGQMTTVHSYTMSQRILDGSHKDLRRGRAAAVSMLPTTTGAAKAVGLVLPELDGKLDGMAVRVPTPDGSLVDLVVEVDKATTADEVNQAFKDAADEHLGYTEIPLVSCDYIGDTHGGVVDGLCTRVQGGTQVKVIVWYDNEAGFTHQLLRLVKKVAASL
ncbi:type I glyceraldehyde-3-phosphate dehydrogenase [Desulfohalovibrio reitneri]|uniref:type I glyceraldehyde-3-phosphate dehydrogenase n=1 Tax=Desulfohalovibrio reitneri TaxID=1307759 RepID=UPI0004A71AA0|nr:type I glyceraldehyde-3-phosphate dehydrogenase [Desulfohalovibrio reitneri]